MGEDVQITETKKFNKKAILSFLIALAAGVSALGYLIPDAVEIPLKLVLEAAKAVLQNW